MMARPRNHLSCRFNVDIGRYEEQMEKNARVIDAFGEVSMGRCVKGKTTQPV